MAGFMNEQAGQLPTRPQRTSIQVLYTIKVYFIDNCNYDVTFSSILH